VLVLSENYKKLMATKRIILIDDHLMVTNGLALLLQQLPAVEVVREFNSAITAIEFLQKNAIDIVITDYSMPEMDGLAFTKAIKTIQPATAVIVLSMHDDVATVKDLVEAGIDGYILKKHSHQELLKAVEAVSNRQSFFSYEISVLMAKMLHQQTKSPTISDREMEVLQLLLQEKSNKQIADILCISERTVETHRKNMMHKMGVNTTIGIIKYAYEHQLIKQ
jgi:two-component system, NarL family, nitrate/nitrite response regulator NarL